MQPNKARRRIGRIGVVVLREPGFGRRQVHGLARLAWLK